MAAAGPGYPPLPALVPGLTKAKIAMSIPTLQSICVPANGMAWTAGSQPAPGHGQTPQGYRDHPENHQADSAYAGRKLMMRKMGLEKVDKVRMACAFDAHVDRTKPLIMGLFPDCELDKIESVGNTAVSVDRVRPSVF